MGNVFTTLDLILFFVALFGVMAVGLIAGRKEETTEDYFLAGRGIPWWGVAGSIFGSNVSANHMVGMMGIGFSIGFAQSHFELGAIAGLMLLCYGFLPVYRNLNVYTLSEYLGRRYDDRSRVAYAVIMIIIMAVVQMVPGLYIGARSICFLIGDQALVRTAEEPASSAATAADETAAPDGEDGAARNPSKTTAVVKQRYYVTFVIALAIVAASYTIVGGLKAVVWTDVMQSTLMLIAGILIAVLTFHRIGGWQEMMALDRTGADKMHLYLPSNHAELPWTGVFTGLMAMHFFYWGTNQFIVQRALGAKSEAEARLGIVAAGFLKLLIPFFAIGTGVAAFYLFQRELPHQNVDPDTAFSELVKLVILPIGPGLIGVISAGLIGAILSSIDSMMNSAATLVSMDIYKRYVRPDASDKQLILVGRVSILAFVVLAAWMAIVVINPNSKDNFFLQIADYQNYLTPGILVAFLLGIFWRRATANGAFAAILAGIFFSWAVESGYNRMIGMDPVEYGLLTGRKTVEQIDADKLPPHISGMAPAERTSYIEQELDRLLPEQVRDGSAFGSESASPAPADRLSQKQAYLRAHETELLPIIAWLGPRLNFFHRVVGVIGLCLLVHIGVSLMGRADPEKSRLVWADAGGHSQQALRRSVLAIAASLAYYAALGAEMVWGWISPTSAAWLGAGWTLAMFAWPVNRSVRKRLQSPDGNRTGSRLIFMLREDQFWAGILCATAVFMLYYFT